MTENMVAIRPRYALSPTQRALYSSQQRHPRSPLQNMIRLTHIDGPIDVERLAAAFAAVVESSDAMRTRLVSEGSETVVQLSDGPARTEVLEIAHSEAAGWAAKRAMESLPLAERAYDSVILVHEDGTVSWYLALHHCITDAGASSLVYTRTVDAYEGRSVPPSSYYDWARQAAKPNPVVDRARAHWDEREPAPRVGDLYERHRPSTPESSRIAVPLAAEVLSSLTSRLETDFRSFSTDLSWTSTLLTSTAAYLHRITGATAFALGLPVHNRETEADAGVIGPLVDVFPVDVSIEPDDSFVTLHRRVSRSLNRTLRYARPGTAPAGVDIEAVVNVIPDAPLDRFAAFPATTERIHSGASDSSHLMRLQLTPYTGIDLSLDLNHRAVAPEHHARAAGHFAAVVAAMAEDPDQPIGMVDLLGEDEAAVLETWGRGAERATPTQHIVDQLAESLLARESTVLTVRGEESGRSVGDSVTGEQLWQWVEHVAAGLQADGVGPGTRVAIEMERSADAVIAILAVLVCGASYVPIDPSQPDARRSRLIERAGCVLTVGSVPPLPDGRGDRPAPVDRSLDDEAYLLFTSGSTGEPKGVPISHRGLADYVEFAATSYLEPGERPVVALFSALTFDLTVTSLFLPLVVGGEMVVIEGDGPTAVRRVAEAGDVTWCKATPSHVEMLVRLLPEEHRLSTLVVGGEAFPASLLTRLHGFRDSIRVFNEYGPTEAVVGCMIHEARIGEFPDSPDVPIGRPAPGVHLRILDANLRAVPVGAAGELCIALDGLTAGYLDGDTSAFVELDGRRWYRSGDLVRLLDDETLVYLRRIDEQLKVGGIRLDPSEIEAALVEHPEVRSAAVRSWAPEHQEPSTYCARCGLADNVPGVVFDADGVCDRCHSYDQVKDQAEAWFKTPDDLALLRDQARADRRGSYDCIALLSGGKDSTYTLYQLVLMGFEVYALTLDNGFISDEAKENIRRTIADLGIEHEFATTEAMAAIFRDSLDRHSNVCHGCFKTIYTLATARAAELGAPLIVTGLSRGQLFETRLIPSQFSENRFDPDAIDDAVIAARIAYHRQEDAATRLLDTTVFETDDVFERIRYVDFYRYVDVELEEMLRFLEQEAPWIRPGDTGRSTNCRINAAGIQTHLLEQGYHNYAEPYAWDVRLGHKQRDEALAELDDRDDADEVAAMLREVEYRPRKRETLTAWICLEPGASTPTPGELRAHLLHLLPSHAIPTAFVVVDELPMTSNGKLDTAALPAPDRVHRSSPAVVVAPTSPLERTVVDVWERQLGVEPISVEDDFFALGGDSLAALEMTMSLREKLEVELPDEIVFANATPRQLAAALVEHLDQDRAPSISGPSVGMGGEVPVLSAGERAMLFEHALEPDDPRYHQGRLYRIDGLVDPERLRAAVSTVVERHQPLHWTFGAERRRLDVSEALAFETTEVAEWDDVEQRATELHRAPFDLEQGPLLRCGVYPVGDVTGLVVVTHHVSTDASSFELLWTEIEAAYHGDELPPLTLSYADHTSWQAGRPSESSREFWLDAVGSVTPLRLHHPEERAPDGLRERTTVLSADELTAAGGSSPFAAVLAAAATVLRRYSHNDEVTVGALATTRDHPSADPLIGYYLNSLPITIEAAPESTLAGVREECADHLARALSHRAYPFADIVDDHRRADRPSPIPQFLIALQDVSRLTFGRHPVHQRILYTGSSVADATVFVQIVDDGVSLAIEHAGSVIDDTIADLLLQDLEAALVAVVRRPDETVDACVLPSAGQSPIEGAPLSDPAHVLSEIFADVSRDEHVAVVHRGEHLTWAELDRWSGAVALRLIDNGVMPGDRVVICLPRSMELVVAILGVMRARAAYVPVDPTYPASRNAAVVAAAGARATIAATAGAPDHLPPDALTMPDRPGAHAALTPLPDPDLDDPAYVIFTSGSTGVPKGVPIGHRQLAASNAARRIEYPEDPERFLLISSAAFDSSIAGLFWTLASHGSLVIPDDQEVHDVDALLDLIDHHDVTHTLLVPSLYRGLLTRGAGNDRWPDRVIVAGEACPADLVRQHHEARPGSRLTNEYGPTEATVWSTVHQIGSGTSGSVPIGHPVPGTWAAVVDPLLRPCPSGVIGELVVGGPTIGDGYDDQTSDGFLSTTDLGPGRAFRTGDLAALVDGSLRFHGRLDDQLNVGGVRIEAAEIEAALERFDGVDAAVVVGVDTRSLDERIRQAEPRELRAALRASSEADDPLMSLGAALADPGRATLAAHLASESGQIDLDLLRQQLRTLLPPSSIPKNYAVHRDLPKSPNGKLDRQAIGNMTIDSGGSPIEPLAGARSADRGFGEFLALWRAALERPDLSGDEDFFDAGGDSLRALDLLFSVEQRYGIRPRVSVLFEARTATELFTALGLDGSTTADNASRALLVREGAVDRNGAGRGARSAPLWLIPGAGGVPLVFQPLVELLDPDLRILSLEFPGTKGECEPLATVDELAAFVHRAMVAEQPEGPYRMVAYSVGGLVAVEVARRLLDEGAEVELLVAIESGLSDGSVSKGMKVRITARLDEGDYVGAGRLFGQMLQRRVTTATEALSGSLRAVTESLAINRYGLRPSDQLVFERILNVTTEAGLRHRPDPIDGRIVLVLGVDGGEQWVDTLRRLWSDVALGGLELHQVSGSHFQGTTLTQPSVSSVADIVVAELAALESDRGSS